MIMPIAEKIKERIQELNAKYAEVTKALCAQKWVSVDHELKVVDGEMVAALTILDETFSSVPAAEAHIVNAPVGSSVTICETEYKRTS